MRGIIDVDVNVIKYIMYIVPCQIWITWSLLHIFAVHVQAFYLYERKHVTIVCFKLTDLFRFKVEQKIDLRSTLQELGIKNIFTSDADLSAMTGDTHSVEYSSMAGTWRLHYKHIDIGTNGQKSRGSSIRTLNISTSWLPWTSLRYFWR